MGIILTVISFFVLMWTHKLAYRHGESNGKRKGYEECYGILKDKALQTTFETLGHKPNEYLH